LIDETGHESGRRKVCKNTAHFTHGIFFLELFQRGFEHVVAESNKAHVHFLLQQALGKGFADARR
jgi:hypothetical protein